MMDDHLRDLLCAVHQVLFIVDHSKPSEIGARLTEVRYGTSPIADLRQAYTTLLNDKEHAGGEG